MQNFLNFVVNLFAFCDVNSFTPFLQQFVHFRIEVMTCIVSAFGMETIIQFVRINGCPGPLRLNSFEFATGGISGDD